MKSNIATSWLAPLLAVVLMMCVECVYAQDEGGEGGGANSTGSDTSPLPAAGDTGTDPGGDAASAPQGDTGSAGAGDTGAAPEPGAGGAAGVDMPDPFAGGVYTKGAWPKEFTNRPLTLPKGVLQAGPLSTGLVIGVKPDAQLVNLAPEVGYGVSDRIMVGLDSGFILNNPGLKPTGSRRGDDLGFDPIIYIGSRDRYNPGSSGSGSSGGAAGAGSGGSGSGGGGGGGNITPLPGGVGTGLFPGFSLTNTGALIPGNTFRFFTNWPADIGVTDTLSFNAGSVTQSRTNVSQTQLFDKQGSPVGKIDTTGLFANFYWEPAEGYKDSPSPLTGTVAYNLAASTPPRDNLGRTGVLNSASLSANFSTSKVNASVDLTLAGQQWTMSGTNIGFGSFTSGSAIFLGQSYGGTSGTPVAGFFGETMTVTKVGCASCSVLGSFNGGFVLQNYAGALLGYTVGEAGTTITGNTIFQRSTTVTDLVPHPTGRYYILLDGTLISASAVTTNASGAMTGFAMGGGATTSQVSFGGTPGNTGTALGGVAAYGTWDPAGGHSQIDQTITTALAPGSSAATYTATMASASNLVPALTGTANYTLAGASAPTTSAGVAGTLNSASLAVDFGRQNFSTSINATVAANTYAASGSGTLGANGQLSLYNTSFSGLTATKNGSALGGASFQLSGALGGDTLASAGYAYAFQEAFGSTTFNGAVSFTGPAQPLSTTAFRDVVTSGHIDQYGGFLSVSGMANPAASASSNAQNQLTSYITPIDPGTFALANTQVSANGSTAYAETGTDALTGLIWGRITGQVATQNRATGATGTANISGSMHYIAGAAASTPTTYPVSGVYSYTYAGGTTPTDNAGNTGVLNSATLQADFTNLKAAASVSATVSGTTLAGSTADARITNSGFLASDGKAVGNFAITCSGTCGGKNTGSLQGVFAGAGAVGAAMAYGMNTAGSGGLNKTISGVAAFRR